MGLPDDADVAELVDALDLGSSAERRGGSSPFIRTNFIRPMIAPNEIQLSRKTLEIVR